MSQIRVELTKAPKQKPQDENNLPFGCFYSDHMFVMDYTEGQGWHDARIVPYAPLALDPAAMCLHYGQEVFEGMKAYRTAEGKINLFRPDENFKRLNVSNQRLCIPALDVDFCIEAVKKLVEVDKDWVPSAPNTSLYIRPFIIATEPHLGVKPASEYKFIIICAPSGPYYKEGLNPVKIYVEENYVRAVKGGTGVAKTGGNYASSLAADAEAHKQGYSQVLWLDGIEKKYIEEVGAMNIFFKIGDEICTPMLNGSILSGITRKSMIAVLESEGYTVNERRISIEEVIAAYEKGQLDEVFGTGTAAVISPVGTLKVGEKVMTINGGKIGKLSQHLYDTLTDIQWGRIAGPKGWVVEVC
ncbi:MAG: branched-chain amino acid aminotransferase [Oscillospiraceae bacterium]|nr:branched-chain amino acid aminotransferase [Oscillospiraceae bacterium]